MPPTVIDDFAVLRSPEFAAALTKFEELTTQSRRAFLIGAGASKCAGLPLMAELTTKALASSKLTPTDNAILTGLVSGFAGAASANIEDYLSELVDLLAIADRRKERKATQQTVQIGGAAYTEEQLSEAAEHIKLAIADALDCADNIDVHRAFVRAIHKTLRPGKWAPDHSVDYLVLNYDTLLEEALALEKMPFSDGLDGGSTGWWNPSTLDRSDLVARVLKLHGSINWCEFAGETLPRRIGKFGSSTPGTERVLIWPASTKYRETQRDPYAQLADRARHVLKPPVSKDLVLVICGYSFGDSHVNIEIDRALRDSNGQLAIVAFTSDSAPTGPLKSWNEDPFVQNQVLIYAKGGFFHGNNHFPATSDLPWWKFTNITRLLGGDR